MLSPSAPFRLILFLLAVAVGPAASAGVISGLTALPVEPERMEVTQGVTMSLGEETPRDEGSPVYLGDRGDAMTPASSMSRLVDVVALHSLSAFVAVPLCLWVVQVQASTWPESPCYLLLKVPRAAAR